MMRPLRILLGAAAALLPVSLLAQSVPVGSVTGLGGVEVRGLSFQSGLGIKSVTEIAVPVAAFWQASSRFSFDVGGHYATVTRKDEAGGSASISGLTDIQARGMYQIVPDVAVFTVAVNLPTGTSKLTAAQIPVANVIASDMIPFPVANFASGFNVTTGLALAVPVSGWALGLAGSYRANGSFTPISDTGAAGASYKAGGEFRVRLGLDRIIGQGRVSLGVTYSSFGEDNFASSPIFQSGKRLIPQASLGFPIGNLGIALYAWDMYRAAGSWVNNTSTEKRNVLTLGVLASVQMGRNVLRPQVEFRSYSTGLCQGAVTSSMCAGGKLVSAGLRYEWAIGDRVALVPVARYDAGNVVDPTSGTAVTFTGWDFGVTLRANM